jgi:hypothetical protein
MVDVGGQRSERRKWLHCFDNMSALIYLVALDEYDMVLEEDRTTNRMEESIKLFQKLTASKWFLKTPVILFLNKSDIFKEKILKKPLTNHFDDYAEMKDKLEGETEFDKSCEYIKQQYLSVITDKVVYPYVTCAIDRGNCTKVFKSVKDTVVTGHMDNTGMF